MDIFMHNLCFSLIYKDCALIVYQYAQTVEKSLSYRKKLYSSLYLESPLPPHSSPSIYESKWTCFECINFTLNDLER